jgi:general secretion pathway protein H
MRTSAIGSALAHGRAVTGAQRGFTLVELLVVLAILTLVATLFPLALNRALPERRLEAQTQALVTEVEFAKMSSAMSGTAVELFVDATGHSSRTSPSPAETATGSRITDRHGRPRASLVLYPDGSASGGRVELSEGANRRVVVVSELTGRVWVERQGAERAR